MKNTANETVTYIKDGNLKTIILNSRNRKKVLREIFVTSYYGSYNQLTATIKDDIDYVHFENVNFIDYRKFICWNPYKKDNNTICIFENCTLELNNISPIYFKNGIFKLINTKLNNIDGIVTIQGKEFHLLENNNLNNEYSLILNSDIININGNLNCLRFSLYSKKIILGNLKNKTNIIIKEDKDEYSEIDITTDELILTNTTLTSNYRKNNGQSIIANKIIIDDISSIKTNQPISINSSLYNMSSIEDIIILTKETLKRLPISSFIKTYNKLINQSIKIKSEEILKEKTNTLIQKIKDSEELKKELEQKLKEQEHIIETLKKELENQNKEIGTKISKSLKKKPLKYFESK